MNYSTLLRRLHYQCYYCWTINRHKQWNIKYTHIPYLIHRYNTNSSNNNNNNSNNDNSNDSSSSSKNNNSNISNNRNNNNNNRNINNNNKAKYDSLLKDVQKKLRIYAKKLFSKKYKKFTKIANGWTFKGQRFNIEFQSKKSIKQRPFEGPGSENEPGGKQDPNKNNNYIIMLIGLIIFVAFLDKFLQVEEMRDISWTYFVNEILKKGEVSRLLVSPGNDIVFVELQPNAVIGKELIIPNKLRKFFFTISDLDSFEKMLNEVQDEIGISSEDRIPVVYQKTNSFLRLLPSLLFLGLLALLAFNVTRKLRGGKGGFRFDVTDISSFIPMKMTILRPNHPGISEMGHKVKFKDIAGMNEAKREVMEFVDYLQKPTKYRNLGARMPKGALLSGPPGTGKTMLAQAIATEASVTFIQTDGPAFIERIGGLGASRVRSLFKLARIEAPCIVYIDEIDAIGKTRRALGESREEEQTLNQLLVEIDGIESLRGVIVFGSTNRPDKLDPALLRPGRFDRQVQIELPTLLERKEIFLVHGQKLKHSTSVSIRELYERMAQLSPGFSGADIANVCNEAALHASRLAKKSVHQADFDYAIDRVLHGMEKLSNPLSSEERKILAYHEAGHALASWALPETDDILKISIAPHTNSPMGFSQYMPSDQKLYTTEQLFQRMVLGLAGRAAESVMFRRISTGAQTDLKEVSELARKKVQLYGMNSRIGHMYLPSPEQTINKKTKRFYSDNLQNMLDEESFKLVNTAYDKAFAIISASIPMLVKIAEKLLIDEVLSKEQLDTILGPKINI